MPRSGWETCAGPGPRACYEHERMRICGVSSHRLQNVRRVAAVTTWPPTVPFHMEPNRQVPSHVQQMHPPCLRPFPSGDDRDGMGLVHRRHSPGRATARMRHCRVDGLCIKPESLAPTCTPSAPDLRMPAIVGTAGHRASADRAGCSARTQTAEPTEQAAWSGGIDRRERAIVPQHR